MSKAQGRNQKRKRRVGGLWKPSALPFQADYNDHFETPETAYRDIIPLLDYLHDKRDSHRVYDPFYCNGRTAVLLNGLGFSRVIHECRDFYKDVDNGTVPAHDTLITNPPYSDNHKEMCLSFALEQLRIKARAFFILMPSYVAARDYYRRLLLANPDAGVVYVIPSTPYEYDHPEGTGHATSPFDSVWYCGVGADRVKRVEKCWRECWDGSARDKPQLVTSLNELERLKAIPTTKRPNPRQRRKRRKQMEAAGAAHTGEAAKGNTSQPNACSPKKSRYRNDKDERKRRRF